MLTHLLQPSWFSLSSLLLLFAIRAKKLSKKRRREIARMGTAAANAKMAEERAASLFTE
jgi:hypothetical protein